MSHNKYVKKGQNYKMQNNGSIKKNSGQRVPSGQNQRSTSNLHDNNVRNQNQYSPSPGGDGVPSPAAGPQHAHQLINSPVSVNKHHQ